MTTRGPIAAQKSRKAPGRSGIVTPKSASRASPTSARSATKRSRSKFMLAPLRIATSLRPSHAALAVQLLSPATAKAPAGSITLRVSSKTSLIAAQISSFVTRTTSSTQRRAIANVASPTWRTATPSAKIPTCSRRTRSPAWSERKMASDSNGSTPTTFTPGMSALR